MEKETVEIKETYDKDGFLIKLEANGLPIFVPKQDFPTIKINIQDVEWISEKKTMTPEEFKNFYRSNSSVT